MTYQCPVCGYSGFSEPISDYDICPSCHTEFGISDSEWTHGELRQYWIDRGAQWRSQITLPPNDWDAIVQLKDAGFGEEEVSNHFINCVCFNNRSPNPDYSFMPEDCGGWEIWFLDNQWEPGWYKIVDVTE